MNRPLTRPTVKDTPETYLRALHQHFVVDKAPRCTILIARERFCSYEGTGCAIGFRLTAEDAKSCPTESLDAPVLNHIQPYFDFVDVNMFTILDEAQYRHDHWESWNGDFAEYMNDFIQEKAKFLGVSIG
jgi:hypothetical protein